MMHTMTLRLDDAEHEALRAVATATGESINGVVRHAVRSYLSDDARRADVTARIRDIGERYSVAFDKLKDL